MADSNCLSRGGLERLTAEEMDQRRVQGVAYQYLCHLEEAKRWMEVVLEEELAPPTELEESLRNGVVLAKLAHHFCPETVPLKKIYDWDQARYQALGLQFRHTDNINHWRAALSALGLPAIFYPETTDVYDKKNMPRVVYCLHALSLFLFRLGRAPQIHDLFGKVDFTDEEINNVKSELDRFGITMPAFHKIGGILANELSVDQAAVHAAVIAINEAVDKGHTEVTAQALRNPNALMENLQDTLMDVYQEILKQSRRQKLLNNRNKGGASEKDIYEEYLTQKEIQQNINTVNVHWAVEQVDQALDSSDSLSLLSALSLPCLSLRGLRPDLSQWYLDQLSADRQQKALDQGCVDPLDPEELQEGVSTANREYQRRNNVDCALLKLNQCLRGSDPRLTLSSLMSPALDLPPLEPSGASLYHSELQQIQRQCPQGALQQEELFVAVEMLTSVCIINQALEAGLMQKFSSSLVGSSASLSDVEPELLHRYFESLQALKLQNRGAVLTWNQLQSQINSVNAEAEEQHQILLSVSLVNEAVMDGDVHRLVSALKQPSLGLNSVSPTNGKRYLRLMRRTQQERAQVARDPEVGLWLSDIEDQVLAANQETQNALKRCLALAAVNQAVREQRSSQTFRVLSLSELQLSGLVLHCAPQYQERLFTLVRQRARTAGGNSPWIGSTLEDGSSFYFHLNKLEGTWNKPQDLNTHFLNRRDIQAVISSVSSEHSRSLQWKQSEALVVKLQAQARGFLLRRQLELRRRHFTKNISAVVTIQSHWRRLVVQRWYRRRLQFLYMNWRAVVKIQSLVRMWLQRRSYRRRLNYFRNNVNAVVKIQAFFRANKAREEYRLLVHSATPPLRVIRKFAHLLELSASDISEEAELLRVSQEVVRTIRFNKQLETDLDLMDLKIGLLVRNRATVQEVASHCKKLTKKNKEQLSDRMDLERSKGLKALSRERRERLEAYQHLFYLLQTQPRYLAQLVFLMPQSKSTAFMEMLVFSLFNYGSDRREGFLLLQLFTQALKYEISLKVEQPQDVVKGNPTVIKMLVNFYRHARGHNALREALGPALKDLIQEPDLSIRTDPTEVYRGWINQTETQTGTKSSLPYEVSPEEALSHPEVQRRIDVALVNLKNLTERVLKAITSNLHLLPYGLRYTAKVLRDALREKFPQANDNEIYKLVGNLVYYRYMNPAVVAPDGFDVLDRSVGSTLSPEQRHLLAAVARMLQHAAVNKGFQGDGYHVRQINQFISSTHLKFRRFFSAVCDVPEPEERFSVDEYSELLSVNKPVIYISLSELRNTHQLLVDHQAVLCSDSSDPLRALLSDLGSVPSLQELSGTAGDYGSSDSDSSVGRTEVSLTLNNKFDIFNDDQDEPDTRGLLLSTKQMIIDVIRTQPGDSLPQILRSSASQHQVALHAWLVQSRARQDAKSPDKLKRNESLMNNSALGLEQKKKKILRNLRHLQARGVLQAEATEGAILSMIAKDIRQQRLHRQRRGAELLRLRLTLNALQAKSSFHSEQMDFYRSYITSCLDKLTQKNQESKGKKKKSLCYSATRLQEKGVLLQIQDLPQSQFKNVLFEIGAGAERGSFTVKARFLGVQMEEFTLTYQDLLQLQYEGVAVMKMFDKAKVNVNLLIFLLNKKFYNK